MIYCFVFDIFGRSTHQPKYSYGVPYLGLIYLKLRRLSLKMNVTQGDYLNHTTKKQLECYLEMGKSKVFYMNIQGFDSISGNEFY